MISEECISITIARKQKLVTMLCYSLSRFIIELQSVSVLQGAAGVLRVATESRRALQQLSEVVYNSNQQMEPAF